MEGEGHQPDSDSETSYDQVHTGGRLFVASCSTEEYFPSMKTLLRLQAYAQHWQPLSRERSYSATPAVTHVCLKQVLRNYSNQDPHMKIWVGWRGESSYGQVQIEWGMSLCDWNFLV